MTNQPIKPEHRELAYNLHQVMMEIFPGNPTPEMAQLIANSFPSTIDQEDLALFYKINKHLMGHCLSGEIGCDAAGELGEQLDSFLSRHPDKTLEPTESIRTTEGLILKTDEGSTPSGSTVCPNTWCWNGVDQRDKERCSICSGTGKISTVKYE